MHRGGRLDEQEVVDQLAVGGDRLGAHAGAGRPQVLVADLRHEPAGGLGEQPAGQRAADLHRAVPPVRPRQPPETRVRQRSGEVAGAPVPPAVALPPQRRHRVRSHVDGSVHTAGQVHAEERELRVRHRVDETADQVGAGQVVVLPAERDDPRRRPRAGQHGDPVGLQAGAVDQLPRPHVTAGGLDRAAADRGHRGAEADLGAGQLRVRRRHRRVVADPGLRGVQAGDAGDVRLVLADAVRAEPGERHAVGGAALEELLQPRQLVLRRGDHDLAGHLVRDPVLAAELDHLPGALDRVPRFAAAGHVVEATVDHAAVVAGLVRGEPLLLLQHQHAQVRPGAAELVRRGHADDPAADDHDVVRVPHAIQPRLPLRGTSATSARSDGQRPPRERTG